MHELLGKCWHELSEDDADFNFCRKCGKHHCELTDFDDFNHNTDYAADPRLVLEAMRERAELLGFLYHIYRVIDLTNYPEDLETLVDLILDRTGRLRDLAIEFFKKEGFGKQYKITGPCEGDCEQGKEA